MSFNIYYALKIEGNLNIEILKKSFQQLIARQESLRTYFVEEDGKPFARVESSWQLELPIIDFSNLSATEKSRKLEKLRETEATKSFNLSQIPLLRVNLVKYTAESSFLILTIHHIIADAWSLEVLRNDLWTIYEVLRQEKENPLPPLKIQYSDFAVWQRQWLRGKTLDHQLNYWQQQLNNIPPLLELPTDYPRPAKQTYQGYRYYFHIHQTIEKQIDKLNEKLGTTLFMFLLSSLGILLSRYSNQEDIVIGTPIANRRRKELESLIGFFANTLPLRLNLLENLNFVQLLTQVKQTTLDAYEHQDIPFEKLVQELQPERSLSYHPLFQVMLVLNNTPQKQWQIPDLDISLYRPDDNQLQTAKFDLVLYIEKKEDGLEAIWEYNTHLFTRETIARLTDNFLVLLEGIIQQPTTPIKNLPILSASEKEKILIHWNNTTKNYPKDKFIHQLFEKQVKLNPHGIAVVLDNEKLTYQQLNTKANQLAHYLKSLGVKSETLVGVCVERSLTMIIGLLGILKAGGTYVPLDPNYPAERLAYILSDSQVSVLLIQNHLKDRLPKHQAQIFCLDTDWRKINPDNINNPISNVKPENLAYIIYTSGSTGKPKGVMVGHQGLSNLVTAQIELFEVKPSSKILQFASLSFDASIWEIVMALGSGACLCLGTPESLLPGIGLVELLEKQKITHVTLPPSALATLPYTDLPELKVIIVAGEACPSELLARWSLGRRFFNAYGPTESTVCATVFECKDISNYQTPPIGFPIANTQVYILDSNLQPVPIGVLGELHIGGVSLACGYLNQSELTAEKFVENPFGEGRLYKTGDKGRYLDNGQIEFLGRLDNQVKIRGFRLELGEIEANLGQHPQIKQAVVVSKEKETGDKYLVAYMISVEANMVIAYPNHVNQNEISTNDIIEFNEEKGENNGAKIKEIREFLLTKLPDYMIPSVFVWLEAFPLTPNGKIDRKALLEYNLEEKRREEFVAPINEIEKILVNIWQEVLKIEKIGIHDNFFKLGGHSLLAVQIVSRIRNSLEIDLFLHYLFQYPTIEELSQYLTELKYLKEDSGTIIEDDFEEIEI